MNVYKTTSYTSISNIYALVQYLFRLIVDLTSSKSGITPMQQQTTENRKNMLTKNITINILRAQITK